MLKKVAVIHRKMGFFHKSTSSFFSLLRDFILTNCNLIGRCTGPLNMNKQCLRTGEPIKPKLKYDQKCLIMESTFSGLIDLGINHE